MGGGGLDLTIPIYSIFDNPPVADMSILLGNGDGTFRAGPAFPLADQNVNNAAVADFWGRPFTLPRPSSGSQPARKSSPL